MERLGRYLLRLPIAWEPKNLIDDTRASSTTGFVRVTPKETEQMYCAVEQQQAVLQTHIDDSKRLSARSDELIHMARSQQADQRGRDGG